MKTAYLFFLSSFILLHSYSQVPGELDTSFHAGWIPEILAVAEQEDGKILLGGQFAAYKDKPAYGLVRLNADKTVDETFDIGMGCYYAPTNTLSQIQQIGIMPDGKILLLGSFAYFNNFFSTQLVMLNTDGSVYTGFNAGTGFGGTYPDPDYQIAKFVIQSDGKILVGGQFERYKSTNVKKLVRLNTDGSLDLTFNTGSGLTGGTSAGDVVEFIQTSDNKIVVTGFFQFVNGVFRNHIARLNTDGSLDASFNPGSGPTGTGADFMIISMVEQTDGKIVLGGLFTYYNSHDSKYIARINTDGSFDGTFSTPPLDTYEYALFLTMQEDGKIWMSSESHPYNSIHDGLPAVRINMDGSIDSSCFTMADYAEGCHIYMLSDGRIILYHGDDKIKEKGLVFLTADLTYLPYEEGHSFHYLYSDFAEVKGDDIYFFNDDGVHKFLTNGQLNSTFGSFVDGNIACALIQPDGKLLLAGSYLIYMSMPAKSIIRLNTDGTLDTTFDSGTGALETLYSTIYPNVKDMKMLPGNRIAIAGSFNTFNGVNKPGVAILNTNGSVYSGFETEPFTFGDFYPDKLLVSPDNKIFAYSDNIIKYNLDGTLDPTVYGETNRDINDAAVSDDGKIVIVGSFTDYNDIPVPGIARINVDGSLDTTLNAGTGFTDGDPVVVKIQTNGKIITGGDFMHYNGTAATFYIRLLPDGTPDPGFIQGNIISHSFLNDVSDIDLLNDGRILLTGDFRNVNQRVCYFKALLFGDPVSCDPPTDLYADMITSSKAVIHWTDDDMGIKYKIYYRPIGTTGWSTKNSVTSFKKLTGLTPSTTYQYKIKTICDGVSSIFTPLHTFTTLPFRLQDEYVINPFEIYPNPNNGNFYMDLSDFSGTAKVRIADMQGKIVYTQVYTNSTTHQIDISGISRGMYVISVDIEGKLFYDKLVIE